MTLKQKYLMMGETKTDLGMFSICNMVLTTKFPFCFSLESLEKSFTDCYAVPFFSARRVKVPNGSAIVFKNGQVNLTGFTSKCEAEQASTFFKNRINYSEEGAMELKIQNITASGSLPFKIDFNEISKLPNAFYEPELFPAIYFENNKETIMLYHTGKFILTGFKSVKRLHSAHEEFVSFLGAHKKE